MEYKIAGDIARYTDYLINTAKLNVSICHLHRAFDRYLHILHPYNAHRTEFCRCIKTNPEAQQFCVQSQDKVLEKCRSGPFCGTCWAGVKEWVFPLRKGDTMLGFISVTGFRSECGEEKLERAAKRYGIRRENLADKYSLLAGNMPGADELETLIAPLGYMFALLYRHTDRPHAEGANGIYRQIVDFLCSNFNRNITLPEIAEHCRYSASHVRHIFMQYSGCTIRQYLTDLRIRRAKEYLTNTSMRIGDIAYEVGFGDANYFTNVFKKVCKITPGAYRRSTAERFSYKRPV